MTTLKEKLEDGSEVTVTVDVAKAIETPAEPAPIAPVEPITSPTETE